MVHGMVHMRVDGVVDILVNVAGVQRQMEREM